MRAVNLLSVISYDWDTTTTSSVAFEKVKFSVLLEKLNDDTWVGEKAKVMHEIRRRTGVQFKIFDANAVNEWCRKNPNKCKD